MFSLNVPLPPAVERLANELHPRLAQFDRVRDRHTLVCKRFDADRVAPANGPQPDRNRAVAELRERLRPLLAGTDPFDLRITEIDRFEAPAQGSGPVVYLVVESPDLVRVHRRLCGAFEPVPGIEGDDYVPHVTLARGGDVERARELAAVEIEPIEWQTHALEIYDADFREPAATVPL